MGNEVVQLAIEYARAAEKARGVFDLKTNRGFAAFIVAKRDADEAFRKLSAALDEESNDHR